jgi:hypothetical protein
LHLSTLQQAPNATYKKPLGIILPHFSYRENCSIGAKLYKTGLQLFTACILCPYNSIPPPHQVRGKRAFMVASAVFVDTYSNWDLIKAFSVVSISYHKPNAVQGNVLSKILSVCFSVGNHCIGRLHVSLIRFPEIIAATQFGLQH